MRQMLFLRIITLAVAALALLGCASRSAPGDLAPAPTVIATESSAESFPAAMEILSGFELAEPEERFADVPGWRAGDRVLLGLRIIRDGAETVRYLEVELTDRMPDPPYASITLTSEHTGPEGWTFGSMGVATELRLFDESGELLASVEGAVPKMLLPVGVYDAVRGHMDLQAQELSWYRSREEFSRTGLGWLALTGMTDSMGRNRLFRRLLDGVVRRPALWRLLVDQSVSIREAEPGPAVTDPWPLAPGLALPAMLVPLELEVAGKPALRGRITVVPQDAPLGLCGGLVHAEAHNPGDPTARVVIRLLAARRGPYIAPEAVEFPGHPDRLTLPAPARGAFPPR